MQQQPAVPTSCNTDLERGTLKSEKGSSQGGYFSRTMFYNGVKLVPYSGDQSEMIGENKDIVVSSYAMDSSASTTPRISSPVPRVSEQSETFEPVYPEYFLTIEEESEKHPYRWSKWTRGCVVLLYALTSFGTQISTSMFGQSIGDIGKRFNISRPVAMLLTTVFMLGMALGPMFIAPVTEKYGRKVGILTPYTLSAIICLVSYPVNSLPGIMVLRFFGGFLSSAPIISSGGALKDMFEPGVRAHILLGYAVLVASGPAFGPIIGGTVAEKLGDYTYIYLITGGYMMLTALVSIFVIKESYRPRLEEIEAKKLSKQFPKITFLTKHTITGKKLSMTKYMVTPYKLLFSHLMFWLSLYACLAFGIMYLGATCMPSITKNLFGWTTGKASLFNISQFVGILVGTVVNIVINNLYSKHTNAVKKGLVEWHPEMRFSTMIMGGFLIAIGFLILWLAHNVGWYTVAIAQACLGAGFFPIFQATLNYVIDIHGDWSASAVSAITFLRSIAAGVTPLISTYMLEELGLTKFSIIMFSVSLATCVIPIIMYTSWANLRKANPYALNYPQ